MYQDWEVKGRGTLFKYWKMRCEEGRWRRRDPRSVPTFCPRTLPVSFLVPPPRRDWTIYRNTNLLPCTLSFTLCVLSNSLSGTFFLFYDSIKTRKFYSPGCKSKKVKGGVQNIRTKVCTWVHSNVILLSSQVCKISVGLDTGSMVTMDRRTLQ